MSGEVARCGSCLAGDHEHCAAERTPVASRCDCQCGVDACTRCCNEEHARCIGRTEPDCDFDGERYHQTNRCWCEVCELYERKVSRWNKPHDVATGDDWTAHVKTLEDR